MFFPPLPPLQLAARNGYPDAIRLLVEKGRADVQERNATTGWVAMHEAAFRGHVECVKVSLLVVSVLLLVAPPTSDPTFFYRALSTPISMQVLLHLNAPLRPRTPDEDTPKELATRYKHPEVVELLEWAADHYPKPRTTTNEFLHKAIDRNVRKIIPSCPFVRSMATSIQ